MHKLGGILNYPSLPDFSTSSTSSHPSSSHSTNQDNSPPNSPPPRISTSPLPPLPYGYLYSDPRRPHQTQQEFTLDLSRVGRDGDGLPMLADRFVKGYIYRRPLQRPGRGGAKREDSSALASTVSALEDSAVLTSLGRGPEGSGRAVVVGNELIRIIAFKSPSSLPSLPPPPHPIPPLFSLYNTSFPAPTPPSTPNTAPYRPTTPNSSSSSRRTPSGSNGKNGTKSRRGGLDFDGGESVGLGVGPGGVEVEEVGTLRGLRDATGGSGVMETRWGTGTMSNKIFVSSRKGSVFVWDVNQPGKIQNNIVVDPTRRPISAMRLAPAGFDTGEMLVTGGHDMIVRVFDLRTSRSTPHTIHTLTSNSYINSLAICPTNTHQIVLGLDNGSLGWIDWRKGNRMANRKFSAHADAVMSVDWKESMDERGEGRAAGGWIASGGLDKKVHIWNNSSPSKNLHRTLRTSLPVSKVSWRPGHDTEIAVSPYSKTSSGTLVDAVEADSQIQIWDVRRGYVPKYLIEGGEGPVAEFAWNDHGSLWTAYKNGLVAQLDVRLHSRPIDDVPRSTVCWDPSGNLAFALDQWTEGELPFDDFKPEVALQLSKLGKVPKSIHDEPFEPTQVFAVYKVPGFDKETFASLAQKYKLEGASPERLCEINARVAARHGLEREWNVWLQLLSIMVDARVVSSRSTTPFSSISRPIPDIDSVPALNLPPPSVNLSPRGRVVPPVPDPRFMPRPRSTSQSPLVRAILPERRSSAGQQGRSGPSRSKLRESRMGSAGTIEVGSTSNVVASTSQVVPVEYQKGRALVLNLDTAFGISSDSSVSTTDESDIEESSNSSFDNAPTPTARHDIRSSFTLLERPTFSQSFNQPSSSSLPSSRRLSPASHVPRPTIRSPVPAPTSPESDSDSDDEDLAPGPYGEVYGRASIISTASTAVVQAASAVPARTTAPEGTDSRKSSPIFSPSTKMEDRKVSASIPPPAPHALGLRKRTEEVSLEVEGWRLELKVRDEAVIWKSFLELHELKLKLVKEWIEFYLGEGDCQMASMIFIVARDVLDFSLVQAERYVTSYVDLLMALELYTSAASVRKYAAIVSLETATQVNTTTHLSCPIHLTHETSFAGDDPSEWSKVGRGTCEKSENAAIVCCLCDLPVASGLLLGCQTCCHGGHASCMELYFSTVPVLSGSGTHPATSFFESSSASDHSHQSYSQPESPSRNRLSGDFNASVVLGREEISGLRFELGTTKEEEGSNSNGTTIWSQICPAGCGHACAVSNFSL
ncbi:hypothetical protein BDY24DRAFT_373801 [Mrakia frigida]|uniref:uncharacterized protein n=1 Tax=Mrakia frigida TaxID=29902 RepID=UPI003FCC1425